jgi:hypothetical protein
VWRWVSVGCWCGLVVQVCNSGVNAAQVAAEPVDSRLVLDLRVRVRWRVGVWVCTGCEKYHRHRVVHAGVRRVYRAAQVAGRSPSTVVLFLT